MNRSAQSNQTGQAQGHGPDGGWISIGQVVGDIGLHHPGVRCTAILVAACVVIAWAAALTTWGGSAGRISPDGSEAFDTFRTFVTGKTAVEYALVEITLNPREADRLFAFAYDSQAFFAREYCTNKHDPNELCMRDKLCGQRGGHYWYYNGDIQNPLLYTSFSPEDTTAGAYGGVETYFKILAGMFQTYGLSDQGLNSLVFRDGLFTVDKQAKNFFITAQIQVDPQGLVTSAEHVIVGLHNKKRFVDKDRILFCYDTTEARTLGLPTSARMEGRNFQIRVLELRLLTPAEQLVEPPFVPMGLLSSTNINRVIHSNKTDYFLLADGRLSSMDGRIADREIADLQAARRFFYVGLSILIALLLLLLRIRSSRVKTYTAMKQTP